MRRNKKSRCFCFISVLFLCLTCCTKAENFALKSPYIKSELPQCAFHVYRHLSKTGGTTMRFIFEKQTVMGEWEFPLIYGFKSEEWAGLLTRWKLAAEDWSKGTRESGPRVLVEVRGNWPSNWPAENFVEKVVPDVLRLKSEFGPTGCQITTSILMREPLPQYLSFYHYYIAKKQTSEAGPNDRGPEAPGAQAWGSGAAEWAEHVRDMQVRELLGTKCTSQMRQPPFQVDVSGGAVTRVGVKQVPKQCEVTAKDVSTARALVRGADVVGVTENFAEFLLMLSDKVGLVHCQHAVSNTGHGERRREALAEDVVQTIHKSTPWDQEIHRLVSEVQQQQIRDAGQDFARRLQLFKNSQVKFGSRAFVGGKPPPSLYKWVDEAEALQAGIERVSPSFFTEPKGGGQAIAYIYFKPVMLVPHNSALRCVKGCTFE
mmetsp:Transcript_12907/g.17649  ORF Transcript_12907/g.17649 Transcript_12907/m.17649 type:complete len:430 (-) Transcript_12907:27-1316(-)